MVAFVFLNGSATSTTTPTPAPPPVAPPAPAPPQSCAVCRGSGDFYFNDKRPYGRRLACTACKGTGAR